MDKIPLSKGFLKVEHWESHHIRKEEKELPKAPNPMQKVLELQES